MTLTRLSAASFLALFALPFCASAQSAGTGDVYACAEITEDLERLACYDSAVGRLKEAEEAGELTTVTRADVEAVERESFGFSLPSLPKIAFPGSGDEEGIEQVEFEIDRIRSGQSGKLTVYLENGQVWQQIDTTETFLNRGDPGVATIKRASFGSFMMTLERGRAFRVRRIQ